MGTQREDSTAAVAVAAAEASPAKPADSSSAVDAAKISPPRASASQELPATLPVTSTAAHPLPNWQAAPIQAFYAHGAAAAAGVTQAYYAASPVSSNSVVWGHQLVPQYAGAGFAYGPFFPPGTIFAPTAMTMGMTYPAAGTEGKNPPDKKNKDPVSKSEQERVSPEKSGNGGKAVTSASGENITRSGDSAQEGSSDTRNEDNESKDLSSSRKSSYGDLAKDGEASHYLAVVPCNGVNAESSHTGRVRSAQKLPVSAPGRTALTFPQTNLNIGMDLWTQPHAGPMSVNVKNDEVQPVQIMAGHDQGMPEQHQWMRDERELRRERRKQSNRESARRSRLRKQQECEELARKVSELTNENDILTEELESLKRVCGELEAENTSISEELTRAHGPNFLAVLGMKNGPSNLQLAGGGIDLFHQIPDNS